METERARTMWSPLIWGAFGVAASLCAGCASSEFIHHGDEYGRTYFIDGAGNWGYGAFDIREGLREVGYQGSIINYRWSPTLNPLLDQAFG